MMILVPTDFSPQAQIALDFACEIALQSEAELLLYHCVENLPQGWTEWPDREKDKDPAQRKIMQEVGEKMQKISVKASNRGIRNQTLISTGDFFKSLSEVMEKHPIDLTIMGTHGISGKQEYFIGSNTQKVIRRVHGNILVVKEHVDKISFKKVLFASDLGQEEKQAFHAFLLFLRFFDTEEIHILTIDTPGFFSQPRVLVAELQKEFSQMAAGYDCTTHFIRNFTIEGGIRKFSEDLGVDLIGISNYQKHPIKRIFSGSNVEMLANHAATPVLSLDNPGN
ncbi:MAG: universal stress protein [Saprospiraceae bacterium]|nr:universal stress protein [Saprospiraceae bacterium]